MHAMIVTGSVSFGINFRTRARKRERWSRQPTPSTMICSIVIGFQRNLEAVSAKIDSVPLICAYVSSRFPT